MLGALSRSPIGRGIAAVVLAGRYLLNPFLALLAGTGAREVMTAAALLVVLGAAALMQFAGMSMALGAFLAGVLLAGSNYRHELEADIEPFRGLLLALFFMGVGMSIDMGSSLPTWAWSSQQPASSPSSKPASSMSVPRTCPIRGDGLRAGLGAHRRGRIRLCADPVRRRRSARWRRAKPSLFTAIAGRHHAARAAGRGAHR